jgi:N-acetylmuramoyl-L-alanine amidase
MKPAAAFCASVCMVYYLSPMKNMLYILAILLSNYLHAQQAAPFIKLINPYKTDNAVTGARQFITGNTCKGCALTINGVPVPVTGIGTFAAALQLQPGDTSFVIKAQNETKAVSKKINYTYTPNAPAQPVKGLQIESIQTFPAGDLLLQPGDKIKLRVKALAGCTVKTADGILLYEQPTTATRGMPGIYQGEWVLKNTDSFYSKKIQVMVTDSAGKSIVGFSKNTIGLFSAYAPNVAITRGRLAHLEYGLGDDRLGGAKMGYLDSNIVLQLSGKVAGDYRVQLAPNRTAYIPEELVMPAPKGTYTPESLTDKIVVTGDSLYDYVKLQLFSRLPYQSFQLLHPSRLVVDVFGATNNTNWITQMNTAKEIIATDYQQLSAGIFRITLQLKHQQHWGHSIYYNGNQLVVRVKRQPARLQLNTLTIGIDAGHGGSNEGAIGAAGIWEKDIALTLALKLEQALKKEGARVIMTRRKEQFVDNKERILFYRDSLPDLLLSLHLNAAEDPFTTGGTSTYYRYIGFKQLSGFLYQRLLQLGLKEYGHTGSFNFMLNSPTEYPNALIETLFISNLQEEEKILNPAFQYQMAEKIVAGIKDFLLAAENE